jgi:surface polysaccharide O-acyltransferase-like enzyme
MHATGDNVRASSRPQNGIELSASARSSEIERIQVARGIACLLLVAYHVVGNQSTSGLQVDAESGYRIFTNFFTYIRMPLFTFLSGFVYAYRPVVRSEVSQFVRKKILRLYLPLMTAATVFFFGHWLSGDGTPPTRLAEIWRIYVFSYEHFWFLQALIIVFAVTMLAESVGGLSTLGRYLAVLIGSLLLFWYEPLDGIELFSFSQSVYLLPFFLLGIGANRFRCFFFSPTVIGLTIVAFLAGQSIHAYDVFELQGGTLDRRSILAIIVGFSTILLAIRWLPRQRLLAYIGGYSFMIYLYHPLFPAAIRIAGSSFEKVPLSALFWMGLAAGLAGPILMEMLVSRYRVARTLVLGQNKPPTMPPRRPF